MPDNEIVKIGPNLLNMADIIEILRYRYDFVTKEDKASDTEKVFGVSADQIAIAISSSDRNTVRNANFLNRIPAADYMLKASGDDIILNSNAVKKIYSDEIRDIRDELYQLKAELSKSGVVTNYLPYSGYHDTFKNGSPVHMNGIIAKNISDSTTQSEIIVGDAAFNLFDVGDWIALDITNESHVHVAKITSKVIDGQTIVFSPSSSHNLRKDLVNIYKSLGECVDGAFCFYKKAESIPDAKERYSCLNDDTFRLRKLIKANNSGYGYSFRLPESQKGFLTKVDIQVKTYGTPGALMCYIIDELDIPKWKNPVKAEADGILLAKSQPLIHPANAGERIASFDFWNGSKFPLLNVADTNERKVRYCMIVEALSADYSDDVKNYYEVVFLKGIRDNITGDLQYNNVPYEYMKKENSSVSPALIPPDSLDPNSVHGLDLYYGITTRAEINDSFIPYRRALYSTQFSTPTPVLASRARVTTRINREGYYITNTDIPSAYNNNTTIPVKKDNVLAYTYDMLEVGGFGLKKDTEDVIVGTNICRISNADASSIEISKGAYIGIEDSVYRAGYEMSLKAKLVEWNEGTCRFETKDSAKFPLSLTAVLADRNKKDKRISDRLIYECDFLDDALEPRKFNQFELQIYWHTEYSNMYEDAKYKNDFVGKIHDLVVSLDRLA